MTRFLSILSLMIAAAAGTLMAQVRWRALNPTDSPPPASSVGRIAKEVRSAGDSSDADSSMTADVGSGDAVLLTEMSRWQFSAADLSRSLQASVKVAAEWRIRRAVTRAMEGMEPDLPEEIQRVELTEGRVIWAGRVTRQGDLYEARLPNGIVTTLTSSEVAGVKSVTRAEYVAATEERYREELTRLSASTRPGPLLRAMARAISREDYASAEEVFPHWLAAGGTESIAVSLAVDERRTLVEDSALIAPVVEDAPLTQAKHPTEGSHESVGPTVRSLIDLESKLKTARRSVGRKLPAKKRQQLTEQVVSWTVWLEHSVADGFHDDVPERERCEGLRRGLSEVLTLLLEELPQ